MKKPALLIRDLVLLQDMCLERELRCERRAREAEAKGDWAQAEYQRELKASFTGVKNRFWDYLQQRDALFTDASNDAPAAGRMSKESCAA